MKREGYQPELNPGDAPEKAKKKPKKNQGKVISLEHFREHGEVADAEIEAISDLGFNLAGDAQRGGGAAVGAKLSIDMHGEDMYESLHSQGFVTKPGPKMRLTKKGLAIAVREHARDEGTHGYEEENPKKKATRKRKVHKSFAKWTDAQKMGKKYPDTFDTPDLDKLKRDVKIGDYVKWNIGAERLWLLVVDVEGDIITGLISNDPLDKKYGFDDVVRIKFKHIYDYKRGTKKTTKRATDFLDGLVEKKKKAKKKSKKKSKKRETLIGKSRRLWNGYVEKPTKKALKSVLDHLEDMEASGAKTVKAEWRRAKRSAKEEAKRLGMKV
jgi:hypothetical protein